MDSNEAFGAWDEDDSEAPGEDWIPLGVGVWLVRRHTARGFSVGWAIEQPGGGIRVSL